MTKIGFKIECAIRNSNLKWTVLNSSEVLEGIFLAFGIGEGQKSQIISFILEAGNQNGHGNSIL